MRHIGGCKDEDTSRNLGSKVIDTEAKTLGMWRPKNWSTSIADAPGD